MDDPYMRDAARRKARADRAVQWLIGIIVLAVLVAIIVANLNAPPAQPADADPVGPCISYIDDGC